MKHVEPRARSRFSSSSGGGYRFLVPAAAYLVGGAVFFRWQLFSGFDLLSGNSGDTRFIIAIHEHLFQVLHGRGTLLSPPFFYDTSGTLGYSDAFILNEALYAPLRLLGAEPFSRCCWCPCCYPRRRICSRSFFCGDLAEPRWRSRPQERCCSPSPTTCT